MLIDTCEHGFPSPRSCVDCMADGAVYPAGPAAGDSGPSVWTTAKFSTRCQGCADLIEVGERIAFDLDAGWVCVACAEGLV